MKNLKLVFTVLIMSLSFSLMGCSGNSESNSTRALFDTKKEAENAAKGFNCRGAHKMGEKWMPCKSHDAYEKGAKRDGNHHHH